MQAARALELLRDHQREIGDVVTEAEAVLRSADAVRGARLVTICWQLLRLLRRYQLFKHTEIFDPLSRHDDPVRVRRANAARERCEAASDAFNRHVLRWSAQGADTLPAEYKDQTAAVLAALRNHFTHEAGDVERLLHGLQRTRQP